jgi:GrpB-like predicted nucleotidyltransferase (UPF0157 family)
MSADAPIEIVPYDPSWPVRFETEEALIRLSLAPWLAGAIEHVGSTAVPGLAAKPVIDIMAGVRSLEESRPAIEVAEQIGYCYAPYRPDAMHWFCKPSPELRTHHLHLVPLNSQQWGRVLAFRNYLRTHPAVSAEYEALKRQLADRHHLDREAYTNAKGPFIDRITELALVDA